VIGCGGFPSHAGAVSSAGRTKGAPPKRVSLPAYSLLRTETGSTAAALRAGSQAAPQATSATATLIHAYVGRSVGSTP